jgi:glutamate--cysteine ligase
MRGVCELLDGGDPQRPFATALDAQAAKVHEPSLTPSARSLLEMRTNGESFFNFALRMSGVHKAYFLELYSPNESRQEEFAREAEESLVEKARVEAADTLSFDEYLARYFGD